MSETNTDTLIALKVIASLLNTTRNTLLDLTYDCGDIILDGYILDARDDAGDHLRDAEECIKSCIKWLTEKKEEEIKK